MTYTKIRRVSDALGLVAIAAARLLPLPGAARQVCLCAATVVVVVVVVVAAAAAATIVVCHFKGCFVVSVPIRPPIHSAHQPTPSVPIRPISSGHIQIGHQSVAQQLAGFV